MEELVFAIPTNILWEIIPYVKTGFIKGGPHDLNRIVQKGIFRNRSTLEEDTSFKQTIPYAIIMNNESLFIFKRGEGQQEKRLHNQLHLGVGGHMNPNQSVEKNEEYPLQELKREFHEELNLFNDCYIEKIDFIGFINDDSIPVGKVHIGLFYVIRISNKSLVINEPEKMTGEWIDLKKLPGIYHELETWSQIAFDNLNAEHLYPGRSPSNKVY